MPPLHDIFLNWLRYARQQKLCKGTREYKQQRKKYFTEHVGSGFRKHFGEDANSLEAWRDICRTVGVENVSQLDSITMCKKALKPKHCNIVDLVSAANAGRTVKRLFETEEALAEDIKKTGKAFPKKEAKRSPLLKEFLVKLEGWPKE